MPETQTPAAPAAPAAKKAKNALNQKQLNDLTKAGQICRAAKKVANAAKLTPRGVTGAAVDETLVKIKTCQSISQGAAKSTRLVAAATAKEAAAKKAMLAGVQAIQSQALNKYRKDAEAKAAYALGQKLANANCATLEATIPAVLERAAADELPGIDEATIAAVQAQYDAWLTADDEQNTAQTDATTQRTDRDAMLKEITATRIAIQLAADAEWPPSDPKSAAKRKEFQLPATRPFRPV